MTQAVSCPGCNQSIAIDDSPQQIEANQLRIELEETKKQPKIQSFIPNYQCKDGTCGQIHQNPRYTSRPKGKCRNCDQFNANEDGKCSWCKQNEIEPIDKEELEDLEIDLPD